MEFGQELSAFRRRKRLSQLALAEMSGVSQRHISFLESGRSKPGRNSVVKLEQALGLSYAEANSFYSSAGLAPPRPLFDIDDPEFEPARRAIACLLRKHAPYPAVATLRSGEIILANDGFRSALEWAFDGLKPWRYGANDNLFELTLHPKGLPMFMVNPDEIIPHTLRRLRAAASSDERAKPVLKRAEAEPDLRKYLSEQEPIESMDSSVLVERYVVHEQPFNLVSMVASFGSPEDVTAQSLQIELFYPDDDETEQTLVGLC